MQKVHPNRKTSPRASEAEDYFEYLRNPATLWFVCIVIPCSVVLFTLIVTTGMYFLASTLREWYPDTGRIDSFDINNTEVGTDECKRVWSKGAEYYNLHELHLGELGFPFRLIDDDSLFILLRNEALPEENACALEALLNKARARKVYAIRLLCEGDKDPWHKDMVYILELQRVFKKYLKFGWLEAREYLRETPLEGVWKCDDDKDLFGAMLLTAWRFGGKVMSTKALVTTLEPFMEHVDGSILGPEILSSPQRCRGVYFITLFQFKNERFSDGFDPAAILRKSRKKYCGSDFIADNKICNGVALMDPNMVCNATSVKCPLVKQSRDDWSSGRATQFHKLCPHVTGIINEKQKYMETLNRTKRWRKNSVFTLL